jgi:hypothetical protein
MRMIDISSMNTSIMSPDANIMIQISAPIRADLTADE